MIEKGNIFAEFEALGEAEVHSRLRHFAFDAPRVAYAERWLNQKCDERLSEAATARERDERETALSRSRRHGWRLAMVGLAVIVPILVLVVAFSVLPLAR